MSNNTSSDNNQYIVPSIEQLSHSNNNFMDTQLVNDLNNKIVNVLTYNKITVDYLGSVVGASVIQFRYRLLGGSKNAVKASINDIVNAIGGQKLKIRMVDLVANSDMIALEVERSIKDEVLLGDILAHPLYQLDNSKISAIVGQDINKDAVVWQLTALPHMLISGCDEYTRSNIVDGMVLSLLYKNAPDIMKFDFIDMAKDLLVKYNSLPHMICDTAVDEKAAYDVISYLYKECDSRAKRFVDKDAFNNPVENTNTNIFDDTAEIVKRKYKGKHIKDIRDFNSSLEDDEPAMPYIVVVINAYEKLMTVENGQFEDKLVNLLPKCYVAGVHIVLVTSSSNKDALSDMIVSNIPHRLMLAIDGEQSVSPILRNSGAGGILAHGEMLSYGPTTSRNCRLHCVDVKQSDIFTMIECISQNK